VAGLGVKLTVGALVDGQALQTGHSVLVPLAGDALLSPDKLASDPHGHVGHAVG